MRDIQHTVAAIIAELVRLPVTKRLEAFLLVCRIAVEDGLVGDYPRVSNSAGARLVADALIAWGESMKWFVYGCVAPSGAVDCHGAYIQNAWGESTCSFCGKPVDVRPRERARLR